MVHLLPGAASSTLVRVGGGVCPAVPRGGAKAPPWQQTKSGRVGQPLGTVATLHQCQCFRGAAKQH